MQNGPVNPHWKSRIEYDEFRPSVQGPALLAGIIRYGAAHAEAFIGQPCRLYAVFNQKLINALGSRFTEHQILFRISDVIGMAMHLQFHG
jgi:hypothetical protein